MTLNSQQQLDDLETCLPDAETLRDNLETLSIDLPYNKPQQEKINLILDSMHELIALISLEQQRLQQELNA